MVAVLNRIKSGINIVCIFMLINIAADSFAANQEGLQGFNWYNEKPKDKKADQKQSTPQKQPRPDIELPEYEKNIRDLKKRHEAAHRKALDNPTTENLLTELRIEKEMMRKSRIYAERRVAVSLLDSSLTKMSEHSNILHKKVQEEIDAKEIKQKLKKLSKEWGLILQISEDCPHCHAFAPIVLEFADLYDFQLLAANKKGKDFRGIEGAADNGQMLIFNPLRETPMLYLVKGDGSQVLPISRGINSQDQIILNIQNIDKHIRRLF